MTKIRQFAALITITVILAAVSVPLRAQEDDSKGNYYIEDTRTFYAGFLAGANFAQVDGDNFAGYRKFGLNVGGIGYVQLQPHLALSWEILFSQKGARSNNYKVSGVDSIVILKYNITASYAEVPLMINYFDKRKSHFGMGFSYSKLVNQKETYETAPKYEIDLGKYPLQNNNFDFVAGAQMHLVKGLFLNIRFQYSLTPMRMESSPVLARTQKQYNNLWTVRFLYLFI